MPQEISRHAADGLTQPRRLGLAAGDALGVELAEPPAVFGRLGKPLDEVGELRVVPDERQRLFQFIGGGVAAVEILVDGDDGRGQRLVQLVLLFGGQPQGVEGVEVSPPHRLLGAEQKRQREAERLRPFEFKPPIDTHQTSGQATSYRLHASC